MAAFSMRLILTFSEVHVRCPGLRPMRNYKGKGVAVLFIVLMGFSYSASQSSAPITREIPTKNPQDVGEKTTRSPAQQKVDSQLLKAARLKRQGLVPTQIDGLQRDSTGRAAVDISGEVTNVLLDTIRREGGEVINSYPQFKAVRAYLTLESLENIASLTEVRMISCAAKAETSRASEIQTEKPAPNSSALKQGVAKTTSSTTQKRRKNRRRHTRNYRYA
jgi:hypothetical protein